MFPELIGRVCLEVAIKAYNRLPLPGHVVTPTVVVTGETLCDYYDCCEDHWTIRWDVVQGLPKEIWSRDAALLSRDQAREFPRVVDFVRYLHDEYYDQLTGGLEQRAAEFGITLRVTDASADLAAGIDQARRAIGKAAANLVRAGEAVMLDAGSTNAYLAQELARRRGENFTVITHSLPVIEALKNAAHITLIGIGGIFHRESQAFLATNAGNVLAGLRVDRAFLGVTGLSVEHGISNIDLAQTDFKRWIIEIAKEVVLVADSLKIGEVALTRIGPISAADKLVTDDQISSRDRLAFAQAGLEVIVATRNG